MPEFEGKLPGAPCAMSISSRSGGAVITSFGSIERMPFSNGPFALMATKFFVALLMLTLFLAACGGGAAPQTPLATTQSVVQPPAMAISRTGASRRDVGWDARRDYKEAMTADCLHEGGSEFNCSSYGRGWFVPWTYWPKGISLPETLTRDRENLIIRAVGIINRSLPAEKRLELYSTPESLDGSVTYWFDHHRAVAKTVLEYIHAEILSLDHSAGLGWTDGYSGYALVSSDLMATPEYAVQTMVHEILHALGLMGHPQHTHTSVLSYQHESTEIFDNIPLIDVAVLYDMYHWGLWSGRIDTVFDVMDGVQFGVHSLNWGRALIPWVDGGHMGPPEPSRLTGRASYEGQLVGKTTLLQQNVVGVAELGFDLGREEGDVRFHTIRHWDGRMWNRKGYHYDLDVYGAYFDSFVEGNDQAKHVPDVVGAFYGYDGEVAAGTLQRTDLTAAFGARKN